MPEIPIPTIPQLIFAALAGFTVFCALAVVISGNLFHSALALVGALFGIAGIFFLLEAEFLGIAQILVYVGAIATLITFAIMLTRGMMFGTTSPRNQQALTATIMAVLLFLVLGGILTSVAWPEVEQSLSGGESLIADMGVAFVTTYVLPFEAVGVLLLVALVGAVMLARDR